MRPIPFAWILALGLPFGSALLGTATCSAAVTTPSSIAEPLPHPPELLAAARAAHVVYQRHFAITAARLGSESSEVRLEAMDQLGRIGDLRAVPLLVPFLDDDVTPEAEVIKAMLTLSTLQAGETAPTLRKLAVEGSEAVQAGAYAALARMKRWAEPDFQAKATSDDKALRGSAITELGLPDAGAAGQVLAKALRSDDRPHIRRMAAIGLGRLGDPSWGPQLTDALTDPDPFVRRYCAEGIVAIGYRQAVPDLLMAMEANVAGAHMAKALRALVGDDFGFDPRAGLLERREAVERAFAWWAANSSW